MIPKNNNWNFRLEILFFYLDIKMPPKLSQQAVSDLFAEYGYQVPQNFVYRNNKTHIRVYDEMNDVYERMTLQQLQYRVRNQRRQRYFNPALLNLPLNDTTPTINDSYERWCSRQCEEFNDFEEEQKRTAYDYFRDVMPIIARKQNTTLNFDQYDDQTITFKVFGLVQALRTVDFSKYDVRLSMHHNDTVTYAHANQNTIEFLYDSFFVIQDVGDSFNAFVNGFMDITSIEIDFRPIRTEGQRRAPGFFPFTHKMEGLDLKKYGIYSNEDEIVNESCLITAFRSSGLLNESEMKLLMSMIKTRHVLKSELKRIAETFKVCINVKTITDYETGKTSHDDVGNKDDPKLKLLIMFDHYLLNEMFRRRGKKGK